MNRRVVRTFQWKMRLFGYGVRAFAGDGGPATQASFIGMNSVVVDSTGAVWIGTVSGLQRFDPAYVAPPPPPQASFHIVPYPNPATTTNLGIRLRLSGAPAGTSGFVYDIGGRRVGRRENTPRADMSYFRRNETMVRAAAVIAVIIVLAVPYRTPAGAQTGITTGIDDQGALLVKTEGRIERIVAGALTWD